MPAMSADVELIERALLSVEQAMARCVLHFEPAPTPTELAALPEAERLRLEQQDRRSARERPESTAAHYCLRSAGALLDVARHLLSRPDGHHPSPQERQSEWDTLVAHTKLAGRGAYRAALVLADTQSHLGEDGPGAGAPPSAAP